MKMMEISQYWIVFWIITSFIAGFLYHMAQYWIVFWIITSFFAGFLYHASFQQRKDKGDT